MSRPHLSDALTYGRKITNQKDATKTLLKILNGNTIDTRTLSQWVAKHKDYDFYQEILNNFRIPLPTTYISGRAVQTSKTPVFAALELKDLDAADLLLCEGFSSIDVTREELPEGYNLVMLRELNRSIERRDENAAFNALDNIENINLRGVGDLAFSSALNNNLPQIALNLLERGVALRSRTEVAAAENPEISAAIARNRAFRTACADGNIAAAQALFGEGTMINSADMIGDTALISAAANGHAEMVAYLLDRGANREAINQIGYRAEDIAKSRFDHSLRIEDDNALEGKAANIHVKSSEDFRAVVEVFRAPQVRREVAEAFEAPQERLEDDSPETAPRSGSASQLDNTPITREADSR